MSGQPPIERMAFLRGHLDGQQGAAPQGNRYEGRCRLAYEKGYGRGYDLRCRGAPSRRPTQREPSHRLR
jgi:hypothetical protein